MFVYSIQAALLDVGIYIMYICRNLYKHKANSFKIFFLLCICVFFAVRVGISQDLYDSV